MNRLLAVALAITALPSIARAQAPGAIEPSATFFERRVPEELAAEGIVLSRQGFRLQLEPVGDQLLISLVEVATGRVAASTKLDSVPVDREAAVAQLTQLTADLVSQVTGRASMPPPVAPAADAMAVLRARDQADYRYKREAIRFGNDYEVSLTTTGTTATAAVHRMWITYQGELDQRLDPESFYDEVGRPDLVEEYRHRARIRRGGLIVSLVGLAAATGFGLYALSQSCDVSLPPAQFSSCLDDRHQWGWWMLGAGAVSLVGGGVALWYHYHPHPISEGEAKSLADEYNQHVRARLGLPVARTEPRVHDVGIAPLAAPHDLGLALGGRF
jgi:hypothetical protein